MIDNEPQTEGQQAAWQMSAAAHRQAMLAWIAAWAAGERDPHADARRREERATALFALQRQAIAPYAAICAAAGADARPLLPVTSLKRHACQVPWAIAAPRAIFETSGTTDGAPGTVRLADTSLYDTALLAGVRRQLLGGHPAPAYRVLSLVPEPSLRPRSSLGHMAATVMATLDDGHGGSFLGVADGVGRGDGQGSAAGLRAAALRSALERAVADDVPVLLLTTTIALELWLDASAGDPPLRLPAGSLVMDTGGPKGRRITARRAEQRRALAERLGIGADRVVAEFGMTELASQRYERPGGDPDAPIYDGPPWLWSVVLDLDTMLPAPIGSLGVVGHIDLANLETAAFLLTADLGRLVPGDAGEPGLQLAGRAPGSEERGCSLVAEEFLP